MKSDFFTDAARIERLHEVFEGSQVPAVRISESFLQSRGRPPVPGPLSRLVAGRHHHALNVLLLLLARSATQRSRQIAITPSFWAPLAALPGQSERNAQRAWSRSVATLVAMGLLRGVTTSRSPVLEVLTEDGSGKLYSAPYDRGDRYFTLPHTYWLAGVDRQLSLPAKATLLITRSLDPDGFTLPLATAMPWYGISSSTLQRGMKELVAAGFAVYQPSVVEAARAPGGFTIRRWYKLAGPMTRQNTEKTQSSPASRAESSSNDTIPF